MKNTAADLNNHLMAELERLGAEDLAGEHLDAEIRRAEAISRVAKQATANRAVAVAGLRAASDLGLNHQQTSEALLTGPGDRAKPNGARP